MALAVPTRAGGALPAIDGAGGAVDRGGRLDARRDHWRVRSNSANQPQRRTRSLGSTEHARSGRWRTANGTGHRRVRLKSVPPGKRPDFAPGPDGNGLRGARNRLEDSVAQSVRPAGLPD